MSDTGISIFGIPIGGTTGGTATRAGSNSINATIQRLRQLGYSDDAIGKMLAGTATGAKLGNVTMDVPLPGGLSFPAWSTSPKVAGIPIKGTAPHSASNAADILSKIFGNTPIATVAQALKNRLSDPRSGAARTGRVVGEVLSGVGKNGVNPNAGQNTVLNGPAFPDYPGSTGAYPNYTPPQLTLHDFSGQATNQINSAFEPYFAALNQQKADTQAKGDRDRQIVGGLYDKYVSDIANQAAQTQDRYNQEEAARAQQGQSLNTQIGQNYTQANDATAKLLQSIGAQQAAPQLLNEGASDQAWQQSQADQNTQAHQDYYNTQAQAQANQDKVYGQAAQNEGVRSQANVMADVSALLSQLGMTEAKQRSDNAMSAIDLANKMQQQDFSAQQANAGLGWNQYQSQVGAYDAAQQAAQNRYNAALQLYQAQVQQTKDQQAQNNWLAEFNQKTAEDNASNYINGLKVKASQGVNPTGLNSVTQQIIQGAGGAGAGQKLAGDISNAAYDVTTGSATPVNDQNAYFAFMQKAQAIAAANGVTVAQIIPYMQQYWTEFSSGRAPSTSGN